MIANSNRPSEINVIFIVGYTRSGSTLLEHLLSIAPRTVAVGEMAYLWEPEVRNNSYCGCGIKLTCCPFWKKILTTRQFDENRSPGTPQFWRFFRDLIYREHRGNDLRYRQFLNQIESVYQAISDQTQGSIIIDSSKRPTFGLAVSRLSRASVTLIHLVRDSRGCAFSWTNRKARAELGDKEYMPRLSAHYAALGWAGKNLQADILRIKARRHIFLRYEDLVRRPAFEVNKILREIGRPAISPDDNGIFHAPLSHGIWGNPDRWSSHMHGIKVTEDQRWVTGLSTRDFAVTTLVSAPLLKWYGYRLFRSRGG